MTAMLVDPEKAFICYDSVYVSSLATTALQKQETQKSGSETLQLPEVHTRGT